MATSDLLTLPVRLSDGTVVLAEIHRGDREEEASWKDYDLSEVLKSLKVLVRDVVTPLTEFSCDKIALEVNVGLALEAGKLTSLVVSGSASSSIKVTMEFGKS
ncbi:MAG: CU044_2847 family protein [Candidatus Zixiibacteriota bacterium]